MASKSELPYEVLDGDCLDRLKEIPDASVDSVVSDPPYHLQSIQKRFANSPRSEATENRENPYGRTGAGFMGQKWDGGDIAFRPDVWRECWRVLKPGGHLIAFGGTRSSHRMICAIEDAGFEIRDDIIRLFDCAPDLADFLNSLNPAQLDAFQRLDDLMTPGGRLEWLYGSGFPKGLNAVKQLVRLALWQSSENVRVAAQNSASFLVKSDGEKEPIAAAFVQILPEGAPALLTEIGGEAALSVLTDTLLSELMVLTGLNTIWSWKGSLEDASKGTNKSIIETKSVTITGRKTYNSLLGLHTSGSIIQGNAIIRDGLKWPAVNAEKSSRAAKSSLRDILIVTALGDATWNPVSRFNGYNVALKPAHEPICLARKPLIGTVAANVLEHGTGAINIDGCRVEGEKTPAPVGQFRGSDVGAIGLRDVRDGSSDALGRWPANIIHDGSDEVIGAFPKSKDGIAGKRSGKGVIAGGDLGGGYDHEWGGFGGEGSAARFFYSAKTDAGDRDAGVPRGKTNIHPTVKPTDLMRWLCRLVTPKGGLVLDPFCGSGSTGRGAMYEGFRFIGIELSPEYAEIARHRIHHAYNRLETNKGHKRTGMKDKDVPVRKTGLFF